MTTKIINKINKEALVKIKLMNKIINSDKYNYEIDIKDHNNISIITVYLDKKIICKGECIFYGIFQKKYKLWVWGTQLRNTNNRMYIDKIKHIKSLDYLFENDKTEQGKFYYQLLTQEIIFIHSKKELTWINYLLLYLTTKNYFLNITTINKNIQFIIIENILEKYI